MKTKKTEIQRVSLKEYNRLVRLVAEEHCMELGVDCPEVRVAKAHWCRRIRREIPYKTTRRCA